MALPAAAQDAAAPAGDVKVEAPKGGPRLRLRRADGAGQPHRPAAADAVLGQAGGGGGLQAEVGHLLPHRHHLGRHAELALSGGDFFRSIWINEIVVNAIEIRPMGVHSIEFDKAGTAQMSFIAIVPGTYTLSIPGSHSETQTATFVIQ